MSQKINYYKMNYWNNFIIFNSFWPQILQEKIKETKLKTKDKITRITDKQKKLLEWW